MMSTQLRGQRTHRRRASACLAAVLVAVVLHDAAAAQTGRTSDDVAKEIARVQVEADGTARAWRDAQFASEELAMELAAAEEQVAEASATLAVMEASLAEVAVKRFMRGGTAGALALFTDDPMVAVEYEALSRLATQDGAVEVDTHADVASELSRKRDEVRALEAKNETLQQALGEMTVRLDAQLVELAQLRTQLEDEEIRRAYEAEVARLRREQEEAAISAALARAVASAAVEPVAPARGTGAGGDSFQPAPVVTSTSLAVSTTEPSGAPNQPVSVPATAGGVAPPDAPSPTAPAVADPRPVSEASADVGGTVSESTTSAAPPELPPATQAPPPTTNDPSTSDVSASGWRCPVAGPTAFGDTWGDARSGGRRHEGVDMMSPSGTPLVAVVAGTVQMKTNALGGNVVWLNGADGARYYYAHLSAWEGGSRSVVAGDVIGYVGRTGNTSANHLHFEIHPGGGAAVNPYPTVRTFC